ncbi:CGNR zinc finger domain-containing protein [Rhizobium sp. KVB221]|uniref:CGNR zinc finger domain-containing protein n=1 Tax=Rhizobium setariae TaxID=2801340 RepID=A0A937CJM3_9HYPH|nr:CGNR zinc finger domain-containing protein [Rhizobium setariae]MBL0371255.1 CGNR zinc finger domain-containing protein [Rhizobium setariae]
MSFIWTPHRFAGGALALDVANSVILRFDPERRIDRFAVPSQLRDFADAAGHLSAERSAFPALAPVASEGASHFLRLREATDAFFRHRVGEGRDDPSMLAELLETIASTIRRHGYVTSPLPVDLATAHSALKLVSQPEPDRMKVCPNCGWLFLDKSRNRSRNWCDMAVCGNRAKARLHYSKKRKEGAS